MFVPHNQQNVALVVRSKNVLELLQGHLCCRQPADLQKRSVLTIARGLPSINTKCLDHQEQASYCKRYRESVLHSCIPYDV